MRLLCDRTYSDCCVDDVNAGHLSANDMIIHFGRCCLSTASDAMNQVGIEGVGEEAIEIEADGASTVPKAAQTKEETLKKQILYVLPHPQSLVRET